MPSMLIETTLLNLGALSHHVGLCSVFSLPTLGWSLLGDKQTGFLMFLQERPRYYLVPLFIFIYPIVLNLLLLMKYY